MPSLKRVVVAVDPSGASGREGEHSDEIGIVVAGLGTDGTGYVLADRSARLGPAQWARLAVTAYHEFRADRIVAERNFGGAMVENVITTAGPNVPVKTITASRGKAVRAEPIAALYLKVRSATSDASRSSRSRCSTWRAPVTSARRAQTASTLLCGRSRS